jgi:hypothetical protein
MGTHTADELANSAKRTEHPASFLDCTNDLIRRVPAGNVCAVIQDILVWGGWRATVDEDGHHSFAVAL